MEEINIYCDESCHIEGGSEQIMLLSCISCPKDKVRKISRDIRKLKETYGIWKFAETKWKKVSASKEEFYIALLEYFINEQSVNFRTIIVDKNILDPSKYPGQSNNSWYYSMIYNLVKYIINRDTSKNYYIFLDKKENSYQAKSETKKTEEFLGKHFHKFIPLQNILSHQSELMQLNDFLQGAVSFSQRKLYLKEGCNPTKRLIMEEIEKKLHISLGKSNTNTKFNIFFWGVY